MTDSGTMVHVRLTGADHAYLSSLASSFDLSLARTVAALIGEARTRQITTLTLHADQP